MRLHESVLPSILYRNIIRWRCSTLAGLSFSRVFFFFNSLEQFTCRSEPQIELYGVARAHSEYDTLQRDNKFTPNTVTTTKATTTTTTTTTWCKETPNNATLKHSSCLCRTRDTSMNAAASSQLDSIEQFCFEHFIPVECELMKSADGYLFAFASNAYRQQKFTAELLYSNYWSLKQKSKFYFLRQVDWVKQAIRCPKRIIWLCRSKGVVIEIPCINCADVYFCDNRKSIIGRSNCRIVVAVARKQIHWKYLTVFNSERNEQRGMKK